MFNRNPKNIIQTLLLTYESNACLAKSHTVFGTDTHTHTHTDNFIFVDCWMLNYLLSPLKIVTATISCHSLNTKILDTQISISDVCLITPSDLSQYLPIIDASASLRMIDADTRSSGASWPESGLRVTERWDDTATRGVRNENIVVTGHTVQVYTEHGPGCAAGLFTWGSHNYPGCYLLLLY